ncbi:MULTISPECIES: peptide chain release factor N(5)-glutamine methyltransferase [Rhodomicrobium]|uniref:peptide chain release factor N(5)-glutamine methyltransferase n=1 Tax=Rhodomicrobium TaxID=1068 RepID=UPI000B4B0F57|nr:MULTISPECIES: peptide chain release factor N(5)-glutamine methyltransferase [Rhodomicrobium]
MPDPALAAVIARRAGLDTARAAIAALAAAFRDAGLPTPELDARLLVFDAAGLTPEAYILRPDHPLTPAEAETIAAYRDRRLAHEPVSRIVGYREFWGRRFKIGPDVLDPRPETETLVEAALDLLRAEGRLGEPLRILDLGTGSGCILLTLLAELPQAWGVGADLSAGALAIAAENARALGLADRCAFVRADWCGTFRGPFALLVTNPPYIRSTDIAALDPGVHRYDPFGALDGGADGLGAYRSIAGNCLTAAAPGSWILVEAGQGQAAEILSLFQEAGEASYPGDWQILPDLAGIERVVAIKRQNVGR